MRKISLILFCLFFVGLQPAAALDTRAKQVIIVDATTNTVLFDKAAEMREFYKVIQ
jgi:D-alanyl-D-alanine carboxypeptidase